MSEKTRNNRDNAAIKKKSRNNRINLRIDDDELQTLTSISFEDEESISQIVRKAIKQYGILRNSKKPF